MVYSIQKQFSFSSGEISPRLHGKSNVEKYSSSLSSSNNLLVGIYGFVTARPGTKYIAQCNSNSVKSYLYRFQYANTQSYILEFTNTKIRFFKDQGQILQGRGITNGTFTTDLTGWTTRNAGTGAVTQSSGKAAFTSSGAGNEARLYQTISRAGIEQYTVTLDVSTNSVTYRVGTSAGGSTLGTGTLTTGTGKTFNFTPTTNTTVYIEFETTANAEIDNVVISTPVYSIDSPYATADCANLIMAQSFDTVYITHPSYAPKKLVRYGHDNWQLDTVTFDEPAYLDENVTTTTLTPSGTSGSITVTASSSVFSSTDVGRYIRYVSGVDDSDAVTYDAPGTSQTFFDIPFFPQTSDSVEVYRVATSGARTALAYNAGVLGANDFKITSGQVEIYAALSTGQMLVVQRKNTSSGIWGNILITGYTSGTQVSGTVVNTLSGTNASTYWRLGAWSSTTGYPALCAFHQQRLWFANTSGLPNGLWGSAVQDFENFSPDNDDKKGQVDSNTSINVVVSDIIAINWMKANNILLLGGEGVKSVNKDGSVIAADNLIILPEESTNCANINPVVTANEIVFVDNQQKYVRAVGYEFNRQGYTTQNINLLADHIFETSPCAQIAYQLNPFPIIWAIRSNGTLVSCTYDSKQEINAWTQHTIGGSSVEVESIAVIPYNNSNELWLTVKRTINGGTKRYIEVLTQPFFEDDKETCIFLDSALTYSGSSTSTITGLSHLEGQTVTVMTNGSYHATKTVSSGQITLNSACTKATVGLGYDINGTTMPLDTGKNNGTAIGSLARINEVMIDFYETDGCKIALNSTDDLQEIRFRPAGLIGGTFYDVQTGVFKEILKSNTSSTYQLYFEQPYPLPFTIRNIVYKVLITDN